MNADSSDVQPENPASVAAIGRAGISQENPVCPVVGEKKNKLTLRQVQYKNNVFPCDSCNCFGHTSQQCKRNKSEHQLRMAGQRRWVRCTNCNEEGHLKHQCMNPKRCFTCGETGPEVDNDTHNAKNCKHFECKNCRSKDHFSKDCPKSRSLGACFLCGKEGHKAKNCERRGELLRCHNCNQPGHLKKDCKATKKDPHTRHARRGRVRGYGHPRQPGFNHQDYYGPHGPPRHPGFYHPGYYPNEPVIINNNYGPQVHYDNVRQGGYQQRGGRGDRTPPIPFHVAQPPRSDDGGNMTTSPQHEIDAEISKEPTVPMVTSPENNDATETRVQLEKLENWSSERWFPNESQGGPGTNTKVVWEDFEDNPERIEIGPNVWRKPMKTKPCWEDLDGAFKGFKMAQTPPRSQNEEDDVQNPYANRDEDEETFDNDNPYNIPDQDEDGFGQDDFLPAPMGLNTNVVFEPAQHFSSGNPERQEEKNEPLLTNVVESSIHQLQSPPRGPVQSPKLPESIKEEAKLRAMQQFMQTQGIGYKEMLELSQKLTQQQ